jgi:hypothetical protein
VGEIEVAIGVLRDDAQSVTAMEQLPYLRLLWSPGPEHRLLVDCRDFLARLSSHEADIEITNQVTDCGMLMPLPAGVSTTFFGVCQLVRNSSTQQKPSQLR